MGAQERVLASRQGGAKRRDNISVFNIIDIYIGKMPLEKVPLKPSASIQPDKAPYPIPVFSIVQVLKQVVGSTGEKKKAFSQ